ncbi:MAG: efflux RND transporter permease subunit [Spirochaetia bacterium]
MRYPVVPNYRRRALRRAVYITLLLSIFISLPSITVAPGSSPFAAGWAQVETECSRLSASQVDRMITEPLSRRILSLPQAVDVYGSSTSEKSLLLVRSPWHTGKDELMSQLLKAVERIRVQLPEGAREPKSTYIKNSSPPILLGITPENPETPAHPETIADSLRRLRWFSEVDLYGLFEEEIHIDIDPYLLGPSSFTLLGTLNTLNSSLFKFTAGGVVENNISVPIEISGGLDSIEKLRDLPLEEADGKTKLSEIARISSEHKRSHEVTVNGDNALLISALPGNRGRVPLLTAFLHLMKPEKHITSAFPGWRVSVLSNPHGALIRLSLYLIALVSITTLASTLIGTAVFRLFSQTALWALPGRPTTARRRTGRALFIGLSAAGVILRILLPLNPYSPPPVGPSHSGAYRRLFLIGDSDPQKGTKGTMAETAGRFAADFPGDAELWTLPASICGYSFTTPSVPSLPFSLRPVEEDITALFIRSSSLSEALSSLSETFSSLSEVSSSLGDRDENTQLIVPHRPSLPEGTSRNAGVERILEAAFEGIYLGTMEYKRSMFAERLFNRRQAHLPVYLFYGKEHLSRSLSSLPIALTETVPPLWQIAEISSSVEPQRIVSLNGSPVRYRFKTSGYIPEPTKE